MGWILIFTPVFVYKDSWRKSFDDLLTSAKKYKLQQTEKEKAEAASRTVSPSNREVGGRFDHMLHIFQGSYFTVSVTQQNLNMNSFGPLEQTLCDSDSTANV